MVSFTEYFSVSWVLDIVDFQLSGLCATETAFPVVISARWGGVGGGECVL